MNLAFTFLPSVKLIEYTEHAALQLIYYYYICYTTPFCKSGASVLWKMVLRVYRSIKALSSIYSLIWLCSGLLGKMEQ
jgi:hypothetical protein